MFLRHHSSIRMQDNNSNTLHRSFPRAVSNQIVSPTAERHQAHQPHICSDGCCPSRHSCMLAATRLEVTLQGPLQPARLAAAGHPLMLQWWGQWAAAPWLGRCTTVRSPQRISCRCMALPATSPPPARHRHCTVCMLLAAGLECSLFITPVTTYCIAKLYHTFQWFYHIIHSILCWPLLQVLSSGF